MGSTGVKLARWLSVSRLYPRVRASGAGYLAERFAGKRDDAGEALIPIKHRQTRDLEVVHIGGDFFDILILKTVSDVGRHHVANPRTGPRSREWQRRGQRSCARRAVLRSLPVCLEQKAIEPAKIAGDIFSPRCWIGSIRPAAAA
jgi:hypothetical protein